LLKKIVSVFIFIILLGALALAQSANTEEVFTFPDPQGDSFGPGSFTYPGDQSFPQELPNMIDLVEFRVVNTDTATRFEFEFAQPPNLVQPWGGAGYNFHRIDLYIASGGKGSKSTFRPGAQVRFREPWQVHLRIRDWQGAYLLHWEDDPEDNQAGIWQGGIEDFQVDVQGNSIVAEIGHSILGPAKANWRYYVLVGLQDAYGLDHWRKIAAEPGPWTGGGGSETEFSPNVYDILAADVKSQEKQLDWAPGKLATLKPVGEKSGTGLRLVAIGAVVLMAVGMAILIWLFRKK
jgi:carbohydrate-binding DOMON domain-containing protein